MLSSPPPALARSALTFCSPRRFQFFSSRFRIWCFLLSLLLFLVASIPILLSFVLFYSGTCSLLCDRSISALFFPFSIIHLLSIDSTGGQKQPETCFQNEQSTNVVTAWEMKNEWSEGKWLLTRLFRLADHMCYLLRRRRCWDFWNQSRIGHINYAVRKGANQIFHFLCLITSAKIDSSPHSGWTNRTSQLNQNRFPLMDINDGRDPATAPCLRPPNWGRRLRCRLTSGKRIQIRYEGCKYLINEYSIKLVSCIAIHATVARSAFFFGFCLSNRFRKFPINLFSSPLRLAFEANGMSMLHRNVQI